MGRESRIVHGGVFLAIAFTASNELASTAGDPCNPVENILILWQEDEIKAKDKSFETTSFIHNITLNGKPMTDHRASLSFVLRWSSQGS